MPSSACPRPTRLLHPLPTRRSSDLPKASSAARASASTASPSETSVRTASTSVPVSRSSFSAPASASASTSARTTRICSAAKRSARADRKSTRLNSSHRCISYAVFCLPPTHPTSTPSPYTTLFRSAEGIERGSCQRVDGVTIGDVSAHGQYFGAGVAQLLFGACQRVGLDVGQNHSHLLGCETIGQSRSEERRVGKECRDQWWPYLGK